MKKPKPKKETETQKAPEDHKKSPERKVAIILLALVLSGIAGWSSLGEWRYLQGAMAATKGREMYNQSGGELREARVELNRAVALDPSSPQPKTVLAMQIIQTERRRFAQRGPSALSHSNLLEALNLLQEAAPYSNVPAIMLQMEAEVASLLATAYGLQGDQERRAQMTQVARDRFSSLFRYHDEFRATDPSAFYRLAIQSSADTGRPDLALFFYRQLYRQSRTKPRLEANQRRLTHLSLLQMGQFQFFYFELASGIFMQPDNLERLVELEEYVESLPPDTIPYFILNQLNETGRLSSQGRLLWGTLQERPNSEGTPTR